VAVVLTVDVIVSLSVVLALDDRDDDAVLEPVALAELVAVDVPVLVSVELAELV
jgi:hypothetical protein